MKKVKIAQLPFVALLIKWSGVAVVDGRGHAGGSVFSKGRSGAYVRNKVTPVNRRTPAQQQVRAILAFFAQGWRALTTAQIAAWNGAASSGFSTNNIFGDAVKKTGIGLYIGLNTNLRTIGEPAISDPPVAGDVGNMLKVAPTAAVTGTTMFLFGENSAGGNTVDANTTLVIVATPPVSKGISFVKSQYRIISTIATGANTDTSNLWSAYVAVFGAPAAGSKIFVGCTAVNLTTGQAGIILSNSLTVGA
jgi:hypothetical protein